VQLTWEPGDLGVVGTQEASPLICQNTHTVR
jgi:hypothetical protein